MATDTPRFNLTTKEMEAPASNDAETVQVRPHWVFRLLGRKHDSATISGDRLEVRVGSEARSVPCADSRTTVRKRLLWADLLVGTPTGTTVLRGLPTAEAFRFSGLARLRGSRPKLGQVIALLAELLESAYYLNRRRQLAWAVEAQAAVESLADVSTVSPPALLASDVHMLDEIRRALHDLDAKVAVRNAAFVAGEMERYGGLFANVESYPLSARQIEAILHDEDHALVVAGAGTGKTSTVVGKIAYLLKSGIAKDHEILALAYNRKAATEMSERARARVGRALEVRTFHALGLQVVTKVQGARPAVSELAADPKGLSRWIGDELDAILCSPSLRHLYLDFAVLERDLAKAPEEFRSAEEFQQYVREQDPRTITGIRVRSFEERLLADWMTLHGVAYEYERPYEHNTATATARQYKPDFYLTDYAIYVEHFGVDRSGATASYVDRAKYHAGMEWKRDLHRRRGTRLIETFSYERMDGTYRDAWRTKFERAGLAI